jgi:hypothetical protein
MKSLIASAIIWIAALWFGPMFSPQWGVAAAFGSIAYLVGAFVEFTSPTKRLTGPDRP